MYKENLEAARTSILNALDIAEKQTNGTSTIDAMNRYNVITNAKNPMLQRNLLISAATVKVSPKEVNSLRSILKQIENLLELPYSSSTARRYQKTIKKLSG